MVGLPRNSSYRQGSMKDGMMTRALRKYLKPRTMKYESGYDGKSIGEVCEESEDTGRILKRNCKAYTCSIQSGHLEK